MVNLCAAIHHFPPNELVRADSQIDDATCLNRVEGGTDNVRHVGFPGGKPGVNEENVSCVGAAGEFREPRDNFKKNREKSCTSCSDRVEVEL